jgi:hypothetical protein
MFRQHEASLSTVYIQSDWAAQRVDTCTTVTQQLATLLKAHCVDDDVLGSTIWAIRLAVGTKPLAAKLREPSLIAHHQHHRVMRVDSHRSHIEYCHLGRAKAKYLLPTYHHSFEI